MVVNVNRNPWQWTLCNKLISQGFQLRVSLEWNFEKGVQRCFHNFLRLIQGGGCLGSGTLQHFKRYFIVGMVRNEWKCPLGGAASLWKCRWEPVFLEVTSLWFEFQIRAGQLPGTSGKKWPGRKSLLSTTEYTILLPVRPHRVLGLL